MRGRPPKIYDATGTLVAHFDEAADLPDANDYVFMGVVSAIPIYKIEFDENPGKDDIAVRDSRFEVKACPDPPGE